VYSIFHVTVENTSHKQIGSKHGRAKRALCLEANPVKDAPTLTNRWVLFLTLGRDLSPEVQQS